MSAGSPYKINRENFKVAFALFVLAATIRLFDIHHAAIVPDERLWLSRSSRILTRLHADPDDATSHMVQPGLTPALVMAAGEFAAHRFNALLRLSFEDRFHISDLDAARSANALFSSLVSPTLYLLAADLVTPFAVLLAGVLVALDSDLIGVARWAHLDSVMTVVVLISALLYLQAVKRGDWRLKALSGVFWGLSILSKPTAGALVVCFLVYRGLRYLLVREYTRGSERTLLSWSDIWAVLIGHLTFAVLHTGIWHRNQEFLQKHPIWHPSIDYAFMFSRFLHRHAVIVIPILILCGLAVWCLLRRGSTRLSYHLAAGLSVVSSVSLLMTISPAVSENLVRYWVWAAGLSHMQDVVWATNALRENHLTYGYWSLVWTQLPVVVSGTFLVFVIWSAIGALRTRSEQHCYNLFFGLTPILWLLLVGSANKQNWRYALPILPLVYLSSAALVGMLVGSRLKSRRQEYIAIICAGMMLLVYSAQNAPHYFLFRTSLSGGLAGAVARSEPIPDFADETLIAQINRFAAAQRAPISIWTGGDTEILRMAAKRYDSEVSQRLRFGARSIDGADFALFFPNSLNRAASEENLRILFPVPVLAYTFREVPLIKLFRVRTRATNSELSPAALQPVDSSAD